MGNEPRAFGSARNSCPPPDGSGLSSTGSKGVQRIHGASGSCCTQDSRAGSYLPQDPQLSCSPPAAPLFLPRQPRTAPERSSPSSCFPQRADHSLCQDSRGCDPPNFWMGQMDHGANCREQGLCCPAPARSGAEPCSHLAPSHRGSSLEVGSVTPLLRQRGAAAPPACLGHPQPFSPPSTGLASISLGR